MSAAAAFFAIMINLVRLLTDHFDPLQVVFFRNAFGVLAILPWLLKQGPSALRTRRPHLHIFRALLGITAMVLWFITLSLMPLAEATALGFTAPILHQHSGGLFSEGDHASPSLAGDCAGAFWAPCSSFAQVLPCLTPSLYWRL